ncbi:MAG: DUF167 domain-containing protein [Thermoprotei archaeon]
MEGSKENIKNVLEKLVEEVMDGVVVTIYVKPESSEEKLVIEGDELVFYTVEPMEKGRANAALIRYFARNLRLPITKLEIIYGIKSKTKRVLVKDFNKDKVIEKLMEHIGTEKE